MSDVQALGPKAKLALSRAELLGAMGYQRINDTLDDLRIQTLPVTIAPPTSGALSFISRWWRRQPARSAFEFLEPGLKRYARLRPGRLVAYSAGAGCLLVVLKPWRLLSVGAVVALLFKATDIASAVTTALRAPEVRPRQDAADLTELEVFPSLLREQREQREHRD